MTRVTTEQIILGIDALARLASYGAGIAATIGEARERAGLAADDPRWLAALERNQVTLADILADLGGTPPTVPTPEPPSEPPAVDPWFRVLTRAEYDAAKPWLGTPDVVYASDDDTKFWIQHGPIGGNPPEGFTVFWRVGYESDPEG